MNLDGKTLYSGRWARAVTGTLERVEGDGGEEALKDRRVSQLTGFAG
jgi:hypothetical protein